MNLKYFKETAKYMLRSKPVIGRRIKEVERLYHMSPEELADYRNERFLHIFRKAITRSPFYKKLYGDHGISINDIRSVDDIGRLPVITSSMFRKAPEDLLTRRPLGLVTAHTSGTTGVPLTVYESWDSLWREQAYFVVYRRLCGFEYGDALVSLRGNLRGDCMSLKVDVSNTLYLSSFLINDEHLQDYVTLIRRHKPRAIEAYPSSLHNLAMLMHDRGIRLDIPIAFTSSETLYPAQKRMIEETFNCRIFDHYGSTERTLSIDQHPTLPGYFESPGYSVAEYHNDHVVATSLINDAFPLIRYRTDDVILPAADIAGRRVISPSGIPVPVPGISAINGRNSTNIIGIDGKRIGNAALSTLVKMYPHTAQAQFIQTEAGAAVLNIVTEDGFMESDIEKIRKATFDLFGKDNLRLDIRRVSYDGLTYTSRNKLPLVVTSIPN